MFDKRDGSECRIIKYKSAWSADRSFSPANRKLTLWYKNLISAEAENFCRSLGLTPHHNPKLRATGFYGEERISDKDIFYAQMEMDI